MWTKDMGQPGDEQGQGDRKREADAARSDDSRDIKERPDSTASEVDTEGTPPGAVDEHQQMLDAMEEHYDFPGDYKIVVIAKVGEGFKARLVAFLEANVQEGGYRMRERKSRKGNFVSYHLHIHVISAEIALERKHAISRLEGVHVLL